MVFCHDALCPPKIFAIECHFEGGFFSFVMCFYFVFLFSRKSCNSYNNNNSKIMIIITPITKNGYYFSIYNVTDINEALNMHDFI